MLIPFSVAKAVLYGCHLFLVLALWFEIYRLPFQWAAQPRPTALQARTGRNFRSHLGEIYLAATLVIAAAGWLLCSHIADAPRNYEFYQSTPSTWCARTSWDLQPDTSADVQCVDHSLPELIYACLLAALVQMGVVRLLFVLVDRRRMAVNFVCSASGFALSLLLLKRIGYYNEDLWPWTSALSIPPYSGGSWVEMYLQAYIILMSVVTFPFCCVVAVIMRVRRKAENRQGMEAASA